MNIAILSNGSLPVPSVKGGGVETLITRFIEQNEIKKEHTITVFSIDDIEAESEAKKFINTKIIYMSKTKRSFTDRLRYRLFGKYPINSPYSYKKAVKYIKNNNFDKVIIENTTWPIEYCAKTFGDKLYVHLHNDWINNDCSEREIKHFRQNISKLNKVIVVSNFMKKRVINAGIQEEKVRVLYNCTDIVKYKTDENVERDIRTKYGIARDKKVILYIGRLCEEKGVRELIEAFKRIEYNNIVLMIVGKMEKDDPYSREIQELAEQCDNRVIFTGYVDNKRIYEIYSVTQFQVIPSIWEEPFGLVAIEALYRGIPVICTNSGGLTEIVDDECGIIVEKNDDIVTNLTVAMNRLLDDKIFCKFIEGVKEFAKKENRFNENNYYANFTNILKES